MMKSAIRYIACKAYHSQWDHVESPEGCGYIWVYALAGKQHRRGNQVNIKYSYTSSVRPHKSFLEHK